MRLLTLFVALLGLTAALWAAVPTDNAVATYYHSTEGYPAWTDAIKWDNVIDMSAYANGATNFAKFESARDELAAKGGGVLYYPAGVYDFSEGPYDGPNGRGLMLKSGVVIRGAAPAEVIDPQHGKLTLGTRFVFGFKKRDAVALDAGERARFYLPSGITFTDDKGKAQTQDLVLSIGVKDGKLQQDVNGYLRDYATAKITGTASTEMKDKDQLVTIAIKLEELPGGAKAEGSYTLTLKQGDQLFTGNFEGGLVGQIKKGTLQGRIAKSAAETPREWNVVGLCPPAGGRISDVKNVGICWVNMEGATVWFGLDMAWGPTWRTAKAWQSALVKDSWADRVPDGTHPMDAICGAETGKPYIPGATGRLIMGCVLQDSAVVNDSMTCGRTGGSGVGPVHKLGFGPDGFYMAKFAPRIGAYGAQVFVAANVLPKSEGRNFKYLQSTVRGVPGSGNNFSFGPVSKSIVLFDYNKICGIDVNKDMVNLSSGDAAYYEPGVTVRDNYVYNNGHKGYNVSGSWVTLKNNTNDRDFLNGGRDPYGMYGWRLTLDGFVESASGGGGVVSDNLSRAFDLGGRALWIDGSYYINTGSTPGNDGEGILCQAHGGTHINSWAITHNKHDKGEGSSSYMGGYNVQANGFLAAWNKDSGSVGVINPGVNLILDTALVANEAATAPAAVDAKFDLILAAPAGVLTAPADVNAVVDGPSVMVTWTDTTELEIGFRVDRSLDAGKSWTAIVYRPRHSKGTPENIQAWRDYTAPSGTAISYRVVAINDKDTDEGASTATAAVTIVK